MSDSNMNEIDLRRGLELALGDRGSEAAISAYLDRGEGELPAGGCLLAWDAIGIHHVVFDSTNAASVRGVSAQLVGLDTALRGGEALDIEPDQVLFAGGGAGMAFVASQEVTAARAGLHEAFARRTHVAACCAGSVPLEGVSFRQAVRGVFTEIARERARRTPGVEAPVPFFALRCEVCGVRAAAIHSPRMTQGRRPECPSCRLRIGRAKDEGKRQGEQSGYERIAGTSRHYAVMYLDGKGLGDAFRSLESPREYQQLSRAVMHMMRACFLEVAKDYGLQDEAPRNGQGSGDAGHLYQLPICGGDDLVAVLPGNLAVPFAHELLRRLQAHADKDTRLSAQLRRPFGAAAGVAIGKEGFPVRSLLLEAEALLKRAKRRLYREESMSATGLEAPRSALDFARVRDGSVRAATDKPERERKADSAGAILLSGRPYTLPEMDTFARRRSLFFSGPGEAVGKTQWRQLVGQARRGRAQLRNHVLFQIGRSPDWEVLARSLVGLAPGERGDDAGYEAAFLASYGGRRTFDLGDMLDLDTLWEEP